MQKVTSIPVNVSIKSTRLDGDGKEDILKTFTKGKKNSYKNNLYIQYQEPQEAGFSNTKTLLKLAYDKLTLNRTGEVEHKQEFSAGKMSAFYYKTPFITIPMLVNTQKVTSVIDEDLIDIYVEYDLIIDGEFQGLTKLHILIWEDTEVGHKRAIEKRNISGM